MIKWILIITIFISFLIPIIPTISAKEKKEPKIYTKEKPANVIQRGSEKEIEEFKKHHLQLPDKKIEIIDEETPARYKKDIQIEKPIVKSEKPKKDKNLHKIPPKPKKEKKIIPSGKIQNKI